MAKKVYIEGKAYFFRPYFRDLGENLADDSDVKAKLLKSDGEYSARIILPFDNRDDAEEYLNGLGIPTENMMGNLLKKEIHRDTGEKIITYKVKRPHMEHNFDDPLMGPPNVIDNDGRLWDEDVAIGNDSELIVKVDVWKGTKATKIRWEAAKVVDLVEYVPDEDSEIAF